MKELDATLENYNILKKEYFRYCKKQVISAHPKERNRILVELYNPKHFSQKEFADAIGIEQSRLSYAKSMMKKAAKK